VLSVLYTEEEFAALRSTDALHDPDYVGVWLGGQIKLIKGLHQETPMAVTIPWQTWRELLESRQAQ
jgi:ligand-binding sensor protein